jgi:riboflavin kinase/FMN adenylyltransferase
LGIIERLKAVATQKHGQSVLFTFSQHPRHVLRPADKEPKLLTTNKEKLDLLEAAGVDMVVNHPFTPDFAAMTYHHFVQEVLVKLLGTRYLIIGHDHRFGRNREGGMEQLRLLAPTLGFEVEEIPVQHVNDIQVSSTKIRVALDAGDVQLANQLLGYRYAISGTVTEGLKLGRNIGFPTANVQVADAFKLIPGNGVYAAIAYTHVGMYKAMVNIGVKPTIATNSQLPTIEANLFNFEGDLYGTEVKLELVSRLRDEQRFSGLDDLSKQLQKDREKSLEILAH